uniref:membrane-spanning 4-domains subfamily A member 4D-like n=1 Tax=Pristiophorus japonicus TaxID=55135 RepID=UPI00398F04FA
MADLSKNAGLFLPTNHLPTLQPLPSPPGSMQYLENGQLNQNIATIIAQNNSGVQAMLRGKLKALGITEIVTGIISIIIGTVQVIRGPLNSFTAFSLIGGTPWWTGVVFVIAESLAVAVDKSPTDCKIKGCLSMNIISAILCLPAVTIYAANFAFLPFCSFTSHCFRYQSGSIECLAILLVLALLNAAISIAISSFNCKAMTCCNTTPVLFPFQPNILMYSNPLAQPNPSLQLNGNPPPYMTVMENVYAG